MHAPMRALVIGLALLAAAGVLVLIGAAMASARHPLVASLGERAVKAHARLLEAGKPPPDIETTLLQIAVTATLKVPPPQRAEGGGLTSLGDELVLLTNDGVVYVVAGGELIRTDLLAPDNQHEAFARTAQDPAWRDYRFLPERLRYHDILAWRATNGRPLYLLASYTEWVPERHCYRNAVARLPLAEGTVSLRGLRAAPGDWTVIARTEPCLPLKTAFRALEGHMSGGRMTRLDARHIALTSGDFHWDGVYAPLNPAAGSTLPLAQDPAAEYGKVLVIDVASGTRRILSAGNRNMQGIATTRDGRLWTVEHGPRGGDELNHQRQGANFGWPRVTLGTQYSRMPWPDAVPYGRHDGYDPPAFSWLPSVAVSGLTRLEGFNPAWDGDLLAASLNALSLFRIRTQGDRALYAERIPIGHRIRQVHQHTDGQVVLWTDNYQLIFLKARSANLAYDHAFSQIEKSSLDAAGKAALRMHLTACLECHSLQYGAHDKAPSLAGVWGRPVGGSGYAATSAALRQRGGRWEETTLDAFLARPSAFAPGTAMPDTGLQDPAVRAELIKILRSVSTAVE
jgi:cytochrome c2